MPLFTWLGQRVTCWMPSKMVMHCLLHHDVSTQRIGQGKYQNFPMITVPASSAFSPHMVLNALPQIQNKMATMINMNLTTMNTMEREIKLARTNRKRMRPTQKNMNPATPLNPPYTRLISGAVRSSLLILVFFTTSGPRITLHFHFSLLLILRLLFI